MESERGQAEIFACILAPILLGGWFLLIVLCVVFLIRGIRLQTELDTPQLLYLRQVPLEGTDLDLNIAFPSKIYPGAPVETLLWITARDSLTTTTPMLNEAFTVSTSVQAPLYVTGTDTISLTVATKGLHYDSLGKFQYESMNLETKSRYADVEYVVAISGTTEAQSVEIRSPLDTEVVRKRIIVERIWEIAGIALGVLIPMLVALAFSQVA